MLGQFVNDVATLGVPNGHPFSSQVVRESFMGRSDRPVNVIGISGTGDILVLDHVVSKPGIFGGDHGIAGKEQGCPAVVVKEFRGRRGSTSAKYADCAMRECNKSEGILLAADKRHGDKPRGGDQGSVYVLGSI